jgi:hypothetical protein
MLRRHLLPAPSGMRCFSAAAETAAGGASTALFATPSNGNPTDAERTDAERGRHSWRFGRTYVPSSPASQPSKWYGPRRVPLTADGARVASWSQRYAVRAKALPSLTALAPGILNANANADGQAAPPSQATPVSALAGADAQQLTQSLSRLLSAFDADVAEFLAAQQDGLAAIAADPTARVAHLARAVASLPASAAASSIVPPHSLFGGRSQPVLARIVDQATGGLQILGGELVADSETNALLGASARERGRASPVWWYSSLYSGGGARTDWGLRDITTPRSLEEEVGVGPVVVPHTALTLRSASVGGATRFSCLAATHMPILYHSEQVTARFSECAPRDALVLLTARLADTARRIAHWREEWRALAAFVRGGSASGGASAKMAQTAGSWRKHHIKALYDNVMSPSIAQHQVLVKLGGGFARQVVFVSDAVTATRLRDFGVPLFDRSAPAANGVAAPPLLKVQLPLAVNWSLELRTMTAQRRRGDAPEADARAADEHAPVAAGATAPDTPATASVSALREIARHSCWEARCFPDGAPPPESSLPRSSRGDVSLYHWFPVAAAALLPLFRTSLVDSGVAAEPLAARDPPPKLVWLRRVRVAADIAWRGVANSGADGADPTLAALVAAAAAGKHPVGSGHMQEFRAAATGSGGADHAARGTLKHKTFTGAPVHVLVAQQLERAVDQREADIFRRARAAAASPVPLADAAAVAASAVAVVEPHPAQPRSWRGRVWWPCAQLRERGKRVMAGADVVIVELYKGAAGAADDVVVIKFANDVDVEDDPAALGRITNVIA